MYSTEYLYSLLYNVYNKWSVKHNKNVLWPGDPYSKVVISSEECD